MDHGRERADAGDLIVRNRELPDAFDADPVRSRDDRSAAIDPDLGHGCGSMRDR
jgi:hypothetical protein